MPVGHDDGPSHGFGALDLSQRAKMEILFAIMLGLFLGALDQTIVSVALPTIITDLGGQELYTWTVTIYLLTSTITVPFYGKLSDLFGRKPLLMIGITLFLVGSALSGLSQNMAQLILFRGIQGLGAGALFPISLAVIGDLFTPAERGKYQGLFGAVFGLSSILGPLLGGWLTEHASWHWIFYVNIPIGIVALGVIYRLLPTVKRPDATRNLDYLGGAVFTVAVGALLIGLTNKQTHAWTDPLVGGLIIVGLVLGAVFLFIESRSKEPIVPLDLWRIRTYATSITATFLISFGFFGAAIFLPQWFQFVQGASPTDSGLYSLALLAGLIISSVGSGLIVTRTGRTKPVILVGLALMAVGLYLMTNLRADTPLPVLWSWMFITGLGIGPTLSVFTIVVQNAVPVRDLGVATSNLTFFRQIGGSVGLALLGTVFANRLTDELPVQLSAAGVPQQMIDQFAASQSGGTSADLIRVGEDLGQSILAQVPEAVRGVVEPFIPNIVFGIHQAFSLAVTNVFMIGVFTTVGALVFTVLMKELPLRKGFGPAQEPEREEVGAGAREGSHAARPALD
ncbi:MAG TPA: MDR family MFS transporter [Candidatus Limnocylindrales bacterium]|jgi:EmrB/QacA subfamily drug resistance transporter